MKVQEQNVEVAEVTEGEQAVEISTPETSEDQPPKEDIKEADQIESSIQDDQTETAKDDNLGVAITIEKSKIAVDSISEESDLI